MENNHETYVVGIVGAGIMGRGTAEAILMNGHRVILIDTSEQILEQARCEIRNSVRGRMLQFVGRENLSAVLSRLTTSAEGRALAECTFLIENVTETKDAKKNAYTEVSRWSHPAAVVAANTSTFPISELALLLVNPERLIGLHFMNPAGSKPLVEMIAGGSTSAETVQRATEFLGMIGKRAILVGDSPGFVSNRVLMLTINEAIGLIHRGVSNASDIDRIFEGCFEHKMGPLATADLIGLDTILLSIQSLALRSDDREIRPSPLLENMVRDGHLGRKTGRGFFQYH